MTRAKVAKTEAKKVSCTRVDTSTHVPVQNIIVELLKKYTSPKRAVPPNGLPGKLHFVSNSPPPRLNLPTLCAKKEIKPASKKMVPQISSPKSPPLLLPGKGKSVKLRFHSPGNLTKRVDIKVAMHNHKSEKREAQIRNGKKVIDKSINTSDRCIEKEPAKDSLSPWSISNK